MKRLSTSYGKETNRILNELHAKDNAKREAQQMSISTKQLAALGWKRTNPGEMFAMYEHASGWHLDHCCHPTANYPYAMYNPSNEFVPAPNGKCFQNVQKAVEWFDEQHKPICGKPHDQALPGFDAALQEKSKAQAAAAVNELNRILREPLGNISHKAGNIERDSPLFFGTGNNPSLF